jgi:BirA family biotin operon repressor/biotin-[acetyl-CoA-carboxylase] ligase
MHALDPAQIMYELEGTNFRAVYCFDVVNSTNTQLILAARYGEPEGTIYTSESQTSGRGRFQRQWESPPSRSLLFSFLLYPEKNFQDVGLLTMTTALSIADALRCAGDVETSIKWPNDVLIDEKKVSGVLAEMEILKDERKALVVGAGVNINQSADELPQNPIRPATSLAIESDRKYDREPILIDILREFSNHYNSIVGGDISKLVRKIRKRMVTIGKPVSFKSNNRSVTGTAIDLTDRGGLLVRLESGVEKEFLATEIEEVQWRL